jgi:hypothetical protein
MYGLGSRYPMIQKFESDFDVPTKTLRSRADSNKFFLMCRHDLIWKTSLDSYISLEAFCFFFLFFSQHYILHSLFTNGVFKRGVLDTHL